MQRAQSQQQMASGMMTPEYAQNSGLLGSLAMVAQAYAGKKMSERAGKDDAAAREAYYKGEAAMKAARKQAEIDRRLEIIRSGDKAMAAAYGVEMPKEEQYKPDWRTRRKSDGSTELVDVNAIQRFDGQGGGSMVMDNAYRDAIAGIESAGSGDYGALGPSTKGGDRAYGRYQVMGANIPEWTQAALGRSMTPQEFLQNPEAQDAVFDHRFGSYVQKYGPEGAARAWFAGEGGMKNPNARDVLGTSVEDYGRKFTQNMGGRSIQWDAPQAGAQKLSTVQQRQRDIAEMRAAGVPMTNGSAQFYIANGKMPEATKPARAGVSKLSGESANKVGLYDNAIRAAKAWHDIVAEKDANGNFTGGYNNAAAMSPRANSLLMQAIRAKLRAESGATISEDEIDGEVERYGARLLGGDATDLQNASALLRDLVQQRKLLIGGNDRPAGSQFHVGQIIEKGGKRYRVTGGDPRDPDVEEVR